MSNLLRKATVGQVSGLTAQDYFTNRVSERRAFAESLRALASDRSGPVSELTLPRTNVLVFFGMGGMGKTRLSQHLEQQLTLLDLPSEAKRRMHLRVDFQDEGAFDLEALLLRLRVTLGQLAPRWPAFDLGFASYWERRHPENPLSDVLKRPGALTDWARKIGVDKQIAVVLEELCHAPGAFSTGQRVTALLVNGLRERRQETAALAQAPLALDILEEQSPTVMLSFLPLLLAWDLSRVQGQKPASVVVFLDTFEAVPRGMECGSFEDHLNRLIHLMPNVLFVLTGRMRLDWADAAREPHLTYSGPKTWPHLTPGAHPEPTQHNLGRLSDEDGDRYLRKRLLRGELPAIPDDVRRRIVAGAEGLPLYLDLSVELFELRHRDEPLDPQIFGTALPKLVLRMMRDLPAAERQLLRSMSLVSAFSSEMLEAAAPAEAHATLHRFVQRHFVQASGNETAPFRMHERLRESVRQCDNYTADPWSPTEWARTAERLLRALEQQGRREVVHGEIGADQSALRYIFAEAFAVGEAAGGVPDWVLDVGDLLGSLGLHDVWLRPAERTRPGQTSTRCLAEAYSALGRRPGQTQPDLPRLRACLNTGLLTSEAEETMRYYLTMHAKYAGQYVEAREVLGEMASGSGRMAARAALELAVVEAQFGRFVAARQLLRSREWDALLGARTEEVLAGIDLHEGRLSAAMAPAERRLAEGRRIGSAWIEALAANGLSVMRAFSSEPHRDTVALTERVEALAADLSWGDGHGTAPAARGIALAGRAPSAVVQGLFDLSLARLEHYPTGQRYALLGRVWAYVIDGDADAARAAHLRLQGLLSDLGTYRFWEVISETWLHHAFRLPRKPHRPRVEWTEPEGEVLRRWTDHLDARRRHRAPGATSGSDL